MRVTNERLLIDRMMYWVICDCGASFWECERMANAKCLGCKKWQTFKPLIEGYQNAKTQSPG